MATTLTHSDFLREVAAAVHAKPIRPSDPPGWFTTRDYYLALLKRGEVVSMSTALRHIEQATQAGRLRYAGKVMRPDRTGVLKPTSAYELVTPKKGGK